MSTVSEDSPKFSGISGDYARVMVIKDRVIIRAINPRVGEAATIYMTPAQARNLAQGIIAAAEKAEARQ